LLHLLGYSLTRHFDGATFWQTHVFEFESYDLYRKTSDLQAASSVDMADASQAGQLLSGVYTIEAGKWRWTAKNFSILLKAPPGFERNGAELKLKLVLPEVQFRSLGPITIRADVSGREFPAFSLSKPDEYVYSAHVPADALRSALAVVNFRLDKAAMGVNGDARELGVVVIAVSLDPARPAQ
jgi:hypothetical protein